MTLGALLIGACAGTAVVPRAPRDLLVAACDDGAFFAFDAREVRMTEADGSVVGRFDVPAASGAPVMAMHDPTGQWSCALYQRQLALLAANRNAAPSWSACDVGPVVSATIVGERLAIVGVRAVTVLRVPSGERLWQAMPSQGLNHVMYAHPTADDAVLLVGSTGGGLMQDAQVLVRRADRSRGDWQVSDTRILDMSLVGACASAGDNLFLAGVWEDSRRVPGGPDRSQRPLLQRLVVVRINVKTNVPTVIVNEESFEHDIRVTDAAAGEDLFALIVDQREVRVFRALGDEAAAAPLWSKKSDAKVTVSWLSRRRIALLSGATLRIEEVPAGGTSG